MSSDLAIRTPIKTDNGYRTAKVKSLEAKIILTHPGTHSYEVHKSVFQITNQRNGDGSHIARNYGRRVLPPPRKRSTAVHMITAPPTRKEFVASDFEQYTFNDT
ncbi:10512_t:CDS:2 [Acaulospora colombiana]|uniref:10512_t:CDS:1 n=1 Tax=Acaulospora colombiana TaxID=27376 RepID=A0ACA9LVB6_9GLOM|nr:10512_t:CDS:2 [Acaulospora colombiana]